MLNNNAAVQAVLPPGKRDVDPAKFDALRASVSVDVAEQALLGFRFKPEDAERRTKDVVVETVDLKTGVTPGLAVGEALRAATPFVTLVGLAWGVKVPTAEAQRRELRTLS